MPAPRAIYARISVRFSRPPCLSVNEPAVWISDSSDGLSPDRSSILVKIPASRIDDRDHREPFHIERVQRLWSEVVVRDDGGSRDVLGEQRAQASDCRKVHD